jgi:hypothetical protein
MTNEKYMILIEGSILGPNLSKKQLNTFISNHWKAMILQEIHRVMHVSHVPQGTCQTSWCYY